MKKTRVWSHTDTPNSAGTPWTRLSSLVDCTETREEEEISCGVRGPVVRTLRSETAHMVTTRQSCDNPIQVLM